jgi:hypothetical protein
MIDLTDDVLLAVWNGYWRTRTQSLTEDQKAAVRRAIAAIPFFGDDGVASAPAPSRTCGNCNFRGPRVDIPDENLVAQDSGFFRCARTKHDDQLSQHDIPLARGVGAVVIDGSGYHAALLVESDFACNRWEPKT